MYGEKLRCMRFVYWQNPVFHPLFLDALIMCDLNFVKIFRWRGRVFSGFIYREYLGHVMR